jgi:hypothetical protein
VDRLEFRGTLGLPEGELRRAVTERFGTAPLASRATDVTRALSWSTVTPATCGAQITPRIDITHDPDRASMTLAIEAGTRARIARVQFDVEPTAPAPPLPTAVTVGQPHDNTAILAALQSYQETQRERGALRGARDPQRRLRRRRRLIVRIAIDQGPLVAVAFAGDPLPGVRARSPGPGPRRGATDEGSSRRLHAWPSRNTARARLRTPPRRTREEAPGASRSASRSRAVPVPGRWSVDRRQHVGSAADIAPLVRLKEGDPFVQSAVNARPAPSVRVSGPGFTKAMVMTAVDVSPTGRVAMWIAACGSAWTSSAPPDAGELGERRWQHGPDRSPGPRGAVDHGGQRTPETDVASNQDRLDLEYRNLGYADVVIEPRVALSDGDTRAAIVFAVRQGPQVIVDHVIILGNRRTSTSTIERELTLKSGQPLGYAARIESQQRLSALGIFRRVTITEVQGGLDPRRDVLVQVEESPPTTIRARWRRRRHAPAAHRTTRHGGGHFEFAPRGFFEVGRNNLWGKNRTITLFARASLRRRDIVLSDTRQLLETRRPTAATASTSTASSARIASRKS